MLVVALLWMAAMLAACKALAIKPDGWARGEREGYGGPCDVTSLSLSPQFSAEVV